MELFIYILRHWTVLGVLELGKLKYQQFAVTLACGVTMKHK